MKDLKWIDINEQHIPQNKKSKLLTLNITSGKADHVEWSSCTFGSPRLVYFKSELPVDTLITHWCELSRDLEWRDMGILLCAKGLSGSQFLVVNDLGCVDHVCVNRNNTLMLFLPRIRYRYNPVGWLSLPEFED